MRFHLFRSEMHPELRPVYKGVLIVECPFLGKCFEDSNIEGEDFLRVRPRIRTFIGYVT